MTSNIHDKVFVWPDTQYIQLGSLSLPTQSKVEEARRLLKSLSLSNMLRELRGNRKKFNDGSMPLRQSQARPDQPIRVSLVGLEHPGEYMEATQYLRASVIDTEGILSDYAMQIQRPFLDAGLNILHPLTTLSWRQGLHVLSYVVHQKGP